MAEAITIFKESSAEHKRLEAAAKLISAETGKFTDVQDILYDAGQDWAWTTIVIESGLKAWPTCQALNPAQQEKIVYGNLQVWFETVNEVIESYR